MARRDAASASRRRGPNLHELLRLANCALQQEATRTGTVAATGSFVTAPTADLADRLLAHSCISKEQAEVLWMDPSCDTATFMALFSLAQRRSSPFAKGDNAEATYASIRNNVQAHLNTLSSEPGLWQQVICEVVGPSLLRTDALACYSRLLATAAEQAQPAAAAVLPIPAASPTAQGQTAAAGPSGAGQPRQEGHVPRGQQRGPKPRQPDLQQLQDLLSEVLDCIAVLGSAEVEPSPITRLGRAAASSNSKPVESVSAHVQSSWVLEHWARALLLGTAPALAGGDDTRTREASAVQANLVRKLCLLHRFVDLEWVDLLRRPWGCAMAFLDVARLCAALDGAGVFGLPPPAPPVLAACTAPEQVYLVRVDNATQEGDGDLIRAGRAVSLSAVVSTLEAWSALLLEGMQEGPQGQVDRGQQGAAARAGAGAGAAVAPAGQGRDGGRFGGEEAAGVAGLPWAEVMARSRSSLPPLNRAATVTLCLRLAKGVLARWGQRLRDVELHGDGSSSSSGVESVKVGPVLPRLRSYYVLFHALACARLALLPDVWGREEVRGRAQAQLREWWETYVAAAQHPEALLVGVAEHPAYPAWMSVRHGVAAQPSPDVAAALDAGLLPCMALQTRRMGAIVGSHENASLWCCPEDWAGFHARWPEVWLHGPLGQVGKLVVELGRRVRLAVGELRAAFERGGAAGNWGGRRSLSWLATMVHEVSVYARHCVNDLVAHVAKGTYPDGAGLDSWACGAAAGAESGAEGEVAGAPAAAGAQGADGAGRQGPPAVSASAGPPHLFAVRTSIALAELAPALSRAAVAAAEMGGMGKQREEWRRQRARMVAAARARGEDYSGDALQDALHDGVACCVQALFCASLLLAKHCGAVVGCGTERAAGGHGGSKGRGSQGAADGAVDTQWRQLLLREVRLMELLAAGLQLHQMAQAGVLVVPTAGASSRASGLQEMKMLRALHDMLQRVAAMTAAVFPAEFRAAVNGGGSGGGAAAASAGDTGGVPGGGSGSGRRDGAACISPTLLMTTLASSGNDQLVEAVVTVLRGTALDAREAWPVVVLQVTMLLEASKDVKETLRLLLPPAEARAAMAEAEAEAEAAEAAAAAAAPAPPL